MVTLLWPAVVGYQSEHTGTFNVRQWATSSSGWVLGYAALRRAANTLFPVKLIHRISAVTHLHMIMAAVPSLAVVKL